MAIAVRLAPAPFEPSDELDELIRMSAGSGAVVSFLGLARDITKAGQPLQKLILDHHPRLTLKSLKDAASDALSRFAVSHVRVVHRCGEVRPLEPIVFAAAAATHRRAAFEAADYLMDRLKTDAIFWKREESADGSFWIEPTEADYADRSRWE